MGLQYAYYNSNVTSASFPNVTTVGTYGLMDAFYLCTNLTSLDLSKLANANAMQALYGICQGCTSLTSVDLSRLSTANGDSALRNAFNGCTSLTTIAFPSLTSVSGGNAMT